jgi:hypothetical protein
VRSCGKQEGEREKREGKRAPEKAIMSQSGKIKEMSSVKVRGPRGTRVPKMVVQRQPFSSSSFTDIRRGSQYNLSGSAGTQFVENQYNFNCSVSITVGYV